MTDEETWTRFASAVLHGLWSNPNFISSPTTGADSRLEHLAAGAADEMLELWRARFHPAKAHAPEHAHEAKKPAARHR